MKKTVILLSGLLFYLFMTALFFMLVGMAEIVRDFSVISVDVNVWWLFSQSFFIVLMRLPLIVFVAVVLLWFHLSQRGWKGFAFFIIPFLLVFMIIWSAYQWIPRSKLSGPDVTLLGIELDGPENSWKSPNQVEYDYSVLEKAFKKPFFLQQVQQFSTEVMEQFLRFKAMGWPYLLLFTFCFVYFSCSFIKWSGLTSWSYMNFMISVLFFIFYLFICLRIWGSLEPLVKGYLSVSFVDPFILPSLFFIGGSGSYISSWLIVQKKAIDG